jgi:hypothetical protein
MAAKKKAKAKSGRAAKSAKYGKAKGKSAATKKVGGRSHTHHLPAPLPRPPKKRKKSEA